MSPCKHSTLNPSSCKVNVILQAPSLVCANTMVLRLRSSLSRQTKQQSFILEGMKTQNCSRLDTVWYLLLTSTLTGFLSETLWSLSTLVVSVAEKRQALLSSGIMLMIWLNCSSKSLLSSLSASSSTRYFRLFRWNPLVFCKWSRILPGVATMTLGFLAISSTCFIASIPPYRTNDLISLSPASLNRQKYSFICIQSSRVGPIMSASPQGIFSPAAKLVRMQLRMGSTKDSVFPLPVSDRHSKSSSLRECLRVSVCILVGFSQPILLRQETISGWREKSSKEDGYSLLCPRCAGQVYCLGLEWFCLLGVGGSSVKSCFFLKLKLIKYNIMVVE